MIWAVIGAAAALAVVAAFECHRALVGRDGLEVILWLGIAASAVFGIYLTIDRL